MNIQESLDINDTVRISARCFEVSPYLARYDNPDMVRGVYAGRFFTIFNGEDPVQKYLTLRRELERFDKALARRLELVVVTKMDVTEAREGLDELKERFAGEGVGRVAAISAVTGAGLDELVELTARLIAEQAGREDTDG